MSIPVTITDAAKERLISLTGQKSGAIGIRLFIAKGKGCGGNEYRMEHMKQGAEAGHDVLPVSDAINLYIPMMDSLHLFNMEIDYVTDELQNSEFVFVNPNEEARCGCGLTFSLTQDEKNADINPEDIQCYREF